MTFLTLYLALFNGMWIINVQIDDKGRYTHKSQNYIYIIIYT